MTREEAKRFGHCILMLANADTDKDTIEYTKIALEALNQEPAVAEIKLQKIRFIIEDKTTASNYKVEQIKGVLDEKR